MFYQRAQQRGGKPVEVRLGIVVVGLLGVMREFVLHSGWTVNGFSAEVATVRVRAPLPCISTSTLGAFCRIRFTEHGPVYFSW